MLEKERAATLEQMLPRASKEFRAWMDDLYRDDPENLKEHLSDRESTLDHFHDFLNEEHHIHVRPDGLVEFWEKTGPVKRIVGDLPVVVWHHTSDAVEKSIRKKGLIPCGKKSSNPHQNSGAGVYVTTETGGPAVEGYKRNAVAHHGGDEMTWGVKTTLRDLHPDPDDLDISVGRRQFVLPHVPPEDLIDDREERRKMSRSESEKQVDAMFADSLGIRREDAPQVWDDRKEKFLMDLVRAGVGHRDVDADPAMLKPSQREWSQKSLDRVGQQYDAGGEERDKLVKNRVVVSKDGYVLDGHHRWLHAKLNNRRLSTVVVDMPIKKLIEAARAFGDAEGMGRKTVKMRRGGSPRRYALDKRQLTELVPHWSVLEPGPHLMLADYLDEHGDPRARIVREAVERAEQIEPQWVKSGQRMVSPDHAESVRSHVVEADGDWPNAVGIPLADNGTISVVPKMGDPDKFYVKWHSTWHSTTQYGSGYATAMNREDTTNLVNHMSHNLIADHPLHTSATEDIKRFHNYLATGDVRKEPQQKMSRTGSPRRYAVPGYEREEAEFHRAILEHPEDPGPSLVYADWLEERGLANAANYLRLRMSDNPMGGLDAKLATAVGKWYAKTHGVPARAKLAGFSVGRGGQDQAKWGVYSKKWHRSYGPAIFKNAGVRLTGGKIGDEHVVIENHLGREVHRVPVLDAISVADPYLGEEPQQMSRYSSPRRYAESTAQGLSSAIAGSQSTNQMSIADVAKDIVTELRMLPATGTDAVHVGPGGSRPSIVVRVKSVRPDKTLYSASWLGLMTRQPGQVVFTPGGGPDLLHTVKTTLSGKDITAALRSVGIVDATLIPRKTGMEALVFDREAKLGAALKTLSTRLKFALQSRRGSGAFVGAPEEKDSRATYRSTIRAYESRLQEQMGEQGQQPQQQGPPPNGVPDAPKQMRRRYARLPDEGVSPKFRPTGIYSGVGRTLQSLAENGSHDVEGVAHHILSTGEYEKLPMFNDAMMESGHQPINGLGVAPKESWQPLITEHNDLQPGHGPQGWQTEAVPYMDRVVEPLADILDAHHDPRAHIVRIDNAAHRRLVSEGGNYSFNSIGRTNLHNIGWHKLRMPDGQVVEFNVSSKASRGPHARKAGSLSAAVYFRTDHPRINWNEHLDNNTGWLKSFRSSILPTDAAKFAEVVSPEEAKKLHEFLNRHYAHIPKEAPKKMRRIRTCR